MRNLHTVNSLALVALIVSTISAKASGNYAQSTIEELVVTAQKREQSLQDVGITVSAFSGDALDSMGVQNSNEIALKTPNLNILSPSGEGGVVSVFIRGVGLNDFALNNTGPVGFYLDDSSIGSSNGQLTTLFDIERVEVLKGPQGTLFGRNTTGGALNIISNKPTSEFQASVKLGGGNYGYLKSEGVVSGGLTELINARLALVGSQSDGYIKNLSTGDYVEKNNVAGRMLLDYNPISSISMLLNVHGSRINGDSDLYGTTADPNFYEGTYGTKEYLINVDTLGSSLQSHYDLSDNVSLTAITAYDDLNKFHYEEADMTSLQLLEFQYNVDTHTFSQELRINGDTDEQQWVAGLYYLSETINWHIASDSSDLPIIPGVLNIGLSDAQGRQNLKTLAGFGQIEQDLFERWTLTVGGRYSRLDVDFDYRVDIPNFSFTPLPSSVAFNDSLRNEKFSGKIALNFYKNEEQMYYGSITKGFKGGGFNGGIVSDLGNYPAKAQYSPETLIAYEIGLKSTILDRSLQMNTALFYYDYKDAQVFNSLADPNTNLPQNQIENAKSLELYGLDMDLSWKPIEALFIQMGIGYTHSEFDQFDLTVPTASGFSSANLSGQTPQNTPKLSANLLASYTWYLGDLGNLSVQIDGSYQSEVFFSNGTITSVGDPKSYIRNKDLSQDAYSLWNARVAWIDINEQFEVALWGKNLMNREYANYKFELTELIGADELIRGTPLTFGIDVNVKF